MLIPHGLIQDRVARLAQCIRESYGNETIHILCVLKGGSWFFNSLLEELRNYHRYNKCSHTPFTFDFIKVKSYAGLESTGKVNISGINLRSIEGKSVLLVEDIIDTGLTMTQLIPEMEKYQPKAIQVATLLEKRTHKNASGFVANFAGFSVPDAFVVGYCLDYNEKFRDLNHICIINQNGIDHFAE